MSNVRRSAPPLFSRTLPHAQLMLSMLGLKSNETGRVSEEELRLIVTGAKMSGGIESQEGMMIEGVLDLQVCFFFAVGLLCLVLSPSGSISRGCGLMPLMVFNRRQQCVRACCVNSLMVASRHPSLAGTAVFADVRDVVWRDVP